MKIKEFKQSLHYLFWLDARKQNGEKYGDSQKAVCQNLAK
jgi:hypothetical protein